MKSHTDLQACVSGSRSRRVDLVDFRSIDESFGYLLFTNSGQSICFIRATWNYGNNSWCFHMFNQVKTQKIIANVNLSILCSNYFKFWRRASLFYVIAFWATCTQRAIKQMDCQVISSQSPSQSSQYTDDGRSQYTSVGEIPKFPKVLPHVGQILSSFC